MGKAVPASHWEQLAAEGMQTWLGGVANVFPDRHGNLIGFPPNASELLALPDPETFCQLPWKKRIARVFCTVFWCREDPDHPEQFLDSDCRGNLKRIQTEFEDKHGLHLRVGCEPEMLWLKPGDKDAPYYETTKPYAYHIDQFEQLSDVWLRVYDYSVAMGLDLIQGDHEDAPGQIELNFQYDWAIRTSDRLTTYRQICAQVAREFNLIAVFMSKPYMGMPANGCHHNVSLWQGGEDSLVPLVDDPIPGMEDNFLYRSGGENKFRDTNEKWLPTELGRWSLGGMIHHLNALVAIGASTVNSYRRLNDTGMWAPVGAGLEKQLGQARTVTMKSTRWATLILTMKLKLWEPMRMTRQLPDPDPEHSRDAAATLVRGSDQIPIFRSFHSVFFFSFSKMTAHNVVYSLLL